MKLVWIVKQYDINVLYNPVKANVVTDALSQMTVRNVSHDEEAKKDLVNNVHRLARLGIRLEDSPNGGITVHNNSQYSFVDEMKSKKHLDPLLMELKESVLWKLKE